MNLTTLFPNVSRNELRIATAQSTTRAFGKQRRPPPSSVLSFRFWANWALGHNCPFLSDPGKPGVRSMGPDVTPSVCPRPCVNLTDVTLADEDTNSILTDNANRAIQGNVAMQ